MNREHRIGSYEQRSIIRLISDHRWRNGHMLSRSQRAFLWFWASFSSFILCHMQVHSSGNYIPMVMSPPKHTIPPSTAAIFLATCLMAVLQPSGYSVFHGGDTPIQLYLPWWSYSCQCLNTETSARGNRGFTNKTLSISYTFCSYIRLVVTL